MSQKAKKPYQYSLLSNELNTRLVLQDAERELEWERGHLHLGVASLYNPQVTVTGFANANIDDKLRFAQENGMFPDVEIRYKKG